MGRILLIEPDHVLGKIYATTIENEGHEICVVDNAQGAIRAIDEQKFDLVILELQLANHNGVEFIYELRSYGEWQNIPIVLHTLVPEASHGLTLRQYKHLGISAYMYKPATSLQKLIQTTEVVLLVPA